MEESSANASFIKKLKKKRCQEDLNEQRIKFHNFDKVKKYAAASNETQTNLEQINYSNFLSARTKEVKDPKNKKFEAHFPLYPNNYYSKNYFIFNYKGNLSEVEFTNKTKEMRKYPLYLKLTIFSNDSDAIIRQRDFSLIKVTVEQLKWQANKFYQKQNYHQSLHLYIKAYGLLKWLSLKDKKYLSYAFMIQNTRPILDNDVEVHSSEFNYGAIDYDDPKSSFSNVISELLLAMSYAFMNLSYYNLAIQCLNECLEYNQENHTAFFRRSQAKYFNRKSNFENIKEALEDIQKAIELSLDSCICDKSKINLESGIQIPENFECKCGRIPKIYFDHYKEVSQLNKENLRRKEEKINHFIDEGYQIFSQSKEKERWNSNEKDSSFKIQQLQSEVLITMKEDYKMMIQSEAEESKKGGNNLFKEFEYFMSRFEEFHFYHNLNIPIICSNFQRNHSIDSNSYVDNSFINFLENYKDKKADSIFQVSDFNIENIRTAINKVMKNEQNKKLSELNLNEFYSKDFTKTYKKRKIIHPPQMSLFVSLFLLLFSMFLMCTQYFTLLRPPNYSDLNKIW